MLDDALISLADKYREIGRLRDEEAGDAGDPKPAMAALAARFPGALRQIDRLPRDEVRSRMRALDAVLEGEGEAPAWAHWEIAYHGRLRAMLRVKRAILHAKDDAEALRLATAAWRQAPDEPAEPMNAERLASIREPPEGRLNPLVVAAVADHHGVTGEEVTAALFPALSDPSGDDGG